MRRNAVGFLGISLLGLGVARADYVYERLEMPNASALTSARGINDLGVIVGSTGGTGVIWDHGQVTTSTRPGTSSTFPDAFSNSGIIVGSVRTSLGNRSFVYDPVSGVCTLGGDASSRSAVGPMARSRWR